MAVVGRRCQRDQYLIESDTGPYDAMNKASRIAQGEWIIFINSGDTFASDIVCEKLLSEEISSFDILYGDHFYKDINDQLFHIKSSEFKGIWNTLKTGRISNAWQESIPCHQATFIRTALLKETPYDLKFQIAADHDFLYKMCASGKRFKYFQEKVAIYSAGGMSQTKKWQCLFEWVDIASKHANPLIVRFYYLVFNPLKARVNRFYKIFSN
ncbi:MAG: glycosyltransferase [Thalassolituus sp.]